jgi:hypothetical protein
MGPSSLRAAHRFGSFRTSSTVVRLAVDRHLALHQADAVAVVHVPVYVTDVQRLNRLAVELVPAVDGDFVGLFLEPVRDHDVLLDPRDQLSQGLAGALRLDHVVVLDERLDRFPRRAQRLRLELHLGVGVHVVEIFRVIIEQPNAAAMRVAVAGVMGTRKKSSSVPTAR